MYFDRRANLAKQNNQLKEFNNHLATHQLQSDNNILSNKGENIGNITNFVVKAAAEAEQITVNSENYSFNNHLIIIMSATIILLSLFLIKLLFSKKKNTPHLNSIQRTSDETKKIKQKKTPKIRNLDLDYLEQEEPNSKEVNKNTLNSQPQQHQKPTTQQTAVAATVNNNSLNSQQYSYNLNQDQMVPHSSVSSSAPPYDLKQVKKKTLVPETSQPQQHQQPMIQQIAAVATVKNNTLNSQQYPHYMNQNQMNHPSSFYFSPASPDLKQVNKKTLLPENSQPQQHKQAIGQTAAAATVSNNSLNSQQYVFNLDQDKIQINSPSSFSSSAASPAFMSLQQKEHQPAVQETAAATFSKHDTIYNMHSYPMQPMSPPPRLIMYPSPPTSIGNGTLQHIMPKNAMSSSSISASHNNSN
jgi:hypothetical protein